eukprot:TRINITY_DN326_c0_g1_i1.p1 TRINITY_DN326_c0_g1~~TRINITY_DN326_c0_g1_i1.p1  ORF type:complete len:265 (+),score=61.29 TRINITY_DN326_c0_g1_i1:129-923(+)
MIVVVDKARAVNWALAISLHSSRSSTASPLPTFSLFCQKVPHYQSRQALSIRAYTDQPESNGVVQFLGKLQASLPVVGLFSRLATDEGGIGLDRLHYGEFCRKVEKRLSPEAQRAFAEFEYQNGKMARKQVVLLWCWVAAVGAGLLRSEDLLLSARRLRVSMDMDYEMALFDTLIDEGLKRRGKSGAQKQVAMEARVAKAMEAIGLCCLGSSSSLSPANAALLSQIMMAVFPSVPFDFMNDVAASMSATPDSTSGSAEGTDDIV